MGRVRTGNPTGRPRIWNESADKVLQRIASEKSVLEAAKVLGVSYASALSRAQVLGIKSKRLQKYTTHDFDGILSEWSTKTARQIAEERGMAHGEVLWCLRKAKQGCAANAG